MDGIRFGLRYWSSVVYLYDIIFFIKKKTAYEMRISDWSSDVCSSDLNCWMLKSAYKELSIEMDRRNNAKSGGEEEESFAVLLIGRGRSEEHTSELQSLMRISYAVFCLKKKK